MINYILQIDLISSVQECMKVLLWAFKSASVSASAERTSLLT